MDSLKTLNMLKEKFTELHVKSEKIGYNATQKSKEM